MNNNSKPIIGIETDMLGNRIYIVQSAKVPYTEAMIVDLEVLRDLVKRYDTPHFKIPDFERTYQGCKYPPSEKKDIICIILTCHTQGL